MLPVGVAGVLVPRSLLAVSTASRCSTVRPVRASLHGPLPQARAPSQGTRRGTGPGLPTRASPPGVLLPFNDVNSRVRLIPGVASPARSALGVFHPLDGFLPARCAASRAAAVPGVPSRSEIRSDFWASCVAAGLAVPCRRGLRSSNSEEYGEEVTVTPDRSNPSAVDPSFVRGRDPDPGASPLRSSSRPPGAETGVSDLPLSRFGPLRPGEPGRFEPAPQGSHPNGRQRISEEIRSSHGVLLHRRDALRRLPVRTSARRRRAVRSRKHPRGRSPADRGRAGSPRPRRLRFTGISRSRLVGRLSRLIGYSQGARGLSV
jgi:hypothetical protein